MKRCSTFAVTAVIAFGAGAWQHANAQAARAMPPRDVPRVSLANVARTGFFYAGGKYVGELGPKKEATMGGAMYVEVMVPKQIRSPYPIVFLHGAGRTAVDWLQTPDGRPGWAYNFLEMGYVVYLQDFPARGRSQYVPGVDGQPGQLNLNIRTAENLEETFTASAARADFPQAKQHTAWPGTGRIGDKVFDDFTKTQVQFLAGPRQETLTKEANIALLDMIGTPVILLTHSQGGGFGWVVADARPNLVKAIVTVEPAAPPIKGVDTSKVAYNAGGGLAWGVSASPITYEPAVSSASELQTVLEEKAPEAGKVPCYVQQEPARKLKNLTGIPVLFLNGEGGYHRVYDHCLAKWLNQAGVKTEYVELEKVGIRGNGHMMMLEKNSADIAKFMGNWLAKNAPAAGQAANKAMPPKTIPTFTTDQIAAKGFLYTGGSYWGEAGRQVMRGAQYTEVYVPKQVRQQHPIVLLHGNGQTGVDWLQTPDGRAGWLYTLMNEGYVVYIVDYPARGRSAYVPLPGPDGKTPIDGNLGIRTALELGRIWTAGRELGDFPLKNNHTQWVGTGKMGDPVFDNFIKTQVQFAGESTNLAVPATVALLDLLKTPVIIFSHSQGGGVGFEVTEQRSQLVRAMVAVEPGGPQFGQVNTSTVEAGPRNPRSWGLTDQPYEYDPPASQPSDLNVALEEKQERPTEARCWMQVEPARKLVRWKNIPVLAPSADGTYHRSYDACIPKFLNQAGVKADFVRLEDVGIRGNSHMMMLERNSDEVIKFIVGWW
ncbi:MAG: alpha/beta fold hydrolase, partial [Vicinamibacterales bacterium]